MSEIDREIIEHLVRQALSEDIGKGDITSEAVIPEEAEAVGHIILKEEGVIAGLIAARLAFEFTDPRIVFEALETDGVLVTSGNCIANIKGPARGILSAERVALNFLQRMSGIATLTSKFVEKARKYPAKIIDTRKTVPGLRVLDKYAVRMGGGDNHRMGLFDAILIKDNHIAFNQGRIDLPVKSALKKYPGKTVEIEIDDIARVREALQAGAHILLLDNMDAKALEKAVKVVADWNKKLPEEKHVRTEASGGVTLENVEKIAKSGVDLISVGALTHSVKALDISLEISR